MIDLAALASLRAVDQHGSVGGAADVLGYTPSAVSQQVKRLERQTGVALLERVGRGVLLTHEGRRLVERGGRLLDDLESLQSGLHADTGQVSARLRVATFSTALRGLVAPVVRALLDDHPDLRLTLVEHEPWQSIDMVATGRADLAIAHSWGDVPLTIPDHLVSDVIAHDRADVVMRCDHPLAGRATVTPHDLVSESWIATPEGTICRQWLRRMYDDTGHPPRIAHVAADFDSHLALVQAGLGIALVPRLGRSPLGPELVAVHAHRPEPTREIVAVHRSSMSASPAIRCVLAALTPLRTGRMPGLVGR
ncbi:MAG: LysR family transcriptional regulator [Nocardioides sp.]|nr:LysR family transcriptional regulator [Nocardioides sp.]